MKSKNYKRLVMPMALVLALVLGILIGRSLDDIGKKGDSGVEEESPKLVSDPESPIPAGEGPAGTVLSGMADRDLRKAGEREVLNDPVSAVMKAQTLPRMDRYAYLDAVFASWGAKNGKEAAVWVSGNLKGTEKSDALTSLAGAWADADPRGAADWFRGNAGGETQEEALSDILDSWSRVAPEAALEWSESLDENVKSWVMEGLAKGWGAVDPAAAAAAGLSFVDTDYGHEFLVSVATQWAASDPRAVARWADEIEDSRLKAAVFLDLGNEWGNANPKAALAWIESIGDEKFRERAEAGFASGWAERDPAAAMDWAVNGMTNPKQSQKVVKEVILGWSEIDPAGVATYMNTLPPGSQTDSILTVFSNSIADLDPYSAISWASTISNQAARSQQVQQLAQDWIDLEGDEAREALKGMDLPPELQKLVFPRP